MPSHFLSRLLKQSLLFAIILGFHPAGLVGEQPTAAFSLGPASVSAQDASAESNEAAPPSFVIRPADQPDGEYVTLTVEPGERASAPVVFGNSGEDDVTARVFAADTFTLTNGGFGARDAGSEPTGPTTWLDYTEETLEFAGGEGFERNIGVTVPEGTPPGEYLTALVIQNAEPVAVAGSDVFSQTLRRAMAILIIVPGPLEPSAEVGEIRMDQSTASARTVVEIRNTGNERLNLTGEIRVTDPEGEVALNGAVTISVIYAGDTTTLELPYGEPLPAGTYQVDLTMNDEQRDVTIASTGVEVDVTAAGATLEPAAPVTLQDVTIVTQPAGGPVQYVDVAATVSNTGVPVSESRLTLGVARDGEPVEDFVLASSLALPGGPTAVEQRYLPAGDWQTGTYTFVLTLDALDAAGNDAGELASITIDTPVVVA